MSIAARRVQRMVPRLGVRTHSRIPYMHIPTPAKALVARAGPPYVGETNVLAMELVLPRSRTVRLRVSSLAARTSRSPSSPIAFARRLRHRRNLISRASCSFAANARSGSHSALSTFYLDGYTWLSRSFASSLVPVDALALAFDSDQAVGSDLHQRVAIHVPCVHRLRPWLKQWATAHSFSSQNARLPYKST